MLMTRLHVFGVTLFLSTTAALADPVDHPMSGFLTIEGHKNFLQYTCDPPTPQGMKCHFAQVLPSAKGGAEALEKALASIPEIQKQFASKPDEKTCAVMTSLANEMRTGASDSNADRQKFLERWRASGEKEKSDTLKDFENFERVCAHPTRQNIEAWLRWQNAKESKTCSLWVNTYEETFTRQSKNNWVRSGTPGGLCGVVVISTFERDDDSGILWNYRTRKVVTDKNAIKDTDMFSCKNYDEQEQVYTWKNDPVYVGCDYIRFGMY